MISNINSIYIATEGEGIFIGRPQFFIRYQGCRVGCINCDSKETWKFDLNSSLKIYNVDIVKKIKAMSSHIKWVSITGGNPLDIKHQRSVINLIELLKKEKYFINIEAAGIEICHEIFSKVDYISFDIKLPSTNVNYDYSIIKPMILKYGEKLQIKSVVSDTQDFDFLYKLYNANRSDNFENWIITPAFNYNDKSITERFILINELNQSKGNCFRVIGQQHKWIYGARKRDV